MTTNIKCLVLGGSYFIGKAFVSALNQSDKFDVYVANRGTHKNIIGKSNIIILDRENEESCNVLANYNFDVVVDISCLSTSMFNSTNKYISAPYYIFISSGLAELKDQSHQDYTYGEQKRLCEDLVKKSFKNHLIVRPGYVVGEDDYTERFDKHPTLPLYYYKGTKEIVRQFIDVQVLAYSLQNMVINNEIGLVKMGYT